MDSFKKEIIYESSQVHFINHEIRRNFRLLSNGKWGGNLAEGHTKHFICDIALYVSISFLG